MSEQFGSRGTRGHSGNREERPGDEAWLASRDEFTRSHEGVSDRPLSGLGQQEDARAESASQGRARFDPSHARDDHDREYARWREEQLRRFDEDYEAWQGERQQKFSQEFGRWRDQRVTKPD